MQQKIQEVDKQHPYHMYTLLSAQSYAALVLDDAMKLTTIAYHEEYHSWNRVVEPPLGNYKSNIKVLFSTDFLLLEGKDQEGYSQEMIYQMIPKYDYMERVYVDSFADFKMVYQLLDFNNIATSTPVATSKYKHIASHLAKFHLEDKRDGIFMYWVNHCFYLTAIQDGRLVHLKYYDAKTNEDVLYYLLAAYKLLDQNPLYYPLYISGFVHEDAQMLEFLRAFIKDIRFENLNPDIDFGDLSFGQHAFPPFYVHTDQA